MKMFRYEQLVRRARSLLYFMDEDATLQKMREDIKDEALLFLVVSGAKVLRRFEMEEQ